MAISKRRKIVLAVTTLLAVAVGSVVAWLGPRNIVGIIRYGHRHEGSLEVGDRAPDVRLVSLDGASDTNLLQHSGSRPLVLIFGSFT